MARDVRGADESKAPFGQRTLKIGDSEGRALLHRRLQCPCTLSRLRHTPCSPSPRCACAGCTSRAHSTHQVSTASTSRPCLGTGPARLLPRCPPPSPWPRLRHPCRVRNHPRALRITHSARQSSGSAPAAHHRRPVAWRQTRCTLRAGHRGERPSEEGGRQRK